MTRLATITPVSEYVGLPGWASRSGETVEVIRELTEDEVGSGTTMYRVRFADGVEADAFADELTWHAAPIRWVPSRKTVDLLCVATVAFVLGVIARATGFIA